MPLTAEPIVFFYLGADGIIVPDKVGDEFVQTNVKHRPNCLIAQLDPLGVDQIIAMRADAVVFG